jgi:hypothetical protein
MSKKPMTTAAMANAMRANPSIACRAPAHEPMSTLVGHVVVWRRIGTRGRRSPCVLGSGKGMPGLPDGAGATHACSGTKIGAFGRHRHGILVWTSGRRFSSSRLESARRCPMCGSRAAGPVSSRAAGGVRSTAVFRKNGGSA